MSKVFGMFLVLLFAQMASANVLYQKDTEAFPVNFNNSNTGEVEDVWVANSFTVVAGGEQLDSITFKVGGTAAFQSSGPSYFQGATPVTVAIYTGTSMTDPNAGGGLQLVASSVATASPTADVLTWVTIPLANPVVLTPGQIYYAAALTYAVPSSSFPFFEDDHSGLFGGPNDGLTNPACLQSFFDVGPGAIGQGYGAINAYNLNDTQNATALGHSQPVLGGPDNNVQVYGVLELRVNAEAVPSRPRCRCWSSAAWRC